MRFSSYLTTLLLAVLLVACGGGGGSPGVGSGSVQALSVAAPATVTLQVGLTQQYLVKGGVKPYSVFSSNPAVAVGWLVGEDVFAIGTTTAGAATVTLVDAKGTRFDLGVTAGSTTALTSSLPANLNLSPGNSQIYTVIGGTGPYTVTSNFPSIATAKIDGSSLTVTGVRIDDINSVTITVRDAAGASYVSAVRVITTKLEVSQGTYKVFLGDTVRLFIKGGTPPYRVLNPLNDAGIATIVNGNEVEIVGTRLADPVEPIIIDADNQTATGAKITFMAGGDNTLRVSPSTISIPENASSPNLVLNVFGVAPGSTLTVFTSNNTLFVPGTPVKVKADGTAYTITLGAGNTCSLVAATNRTATITVLDSSGRSGTSVITVTDSDGLVGCTI